MFAAEKMQAAGKAGRFLWIEEAAVSRGTRPFVTKDGIFRVSVIFIKARVNKTDSTCRPLNWVDALEIIEKGKCSKLLLSRDIVVKRWVVPGRWSGLVRELFDLCSTPYY